MTVTLRPTEGGTELRLEHEEFFDAEARDDHQEGWSAALTGSRARLAARRFAKRCVALVLFTLILTENDHLKGAGPGMKLLFVRAMQLGQWTSAKPLLRSAATCRNASICAEPTGVERMAGLVEVDDERRVI